MKKRQMDWKEFHRQSQHFQNCAIIYWRDKNKESIRGIIISVETVDVGAPGWRITVKTETGTIEHLTFSSWLDVNKPKELEGGEIELTLTDGIAVILQEKEGEISFTM